MIRSQRQRITTPVAGAFTALATLLPFPAWAQSGYPFAVIQIGPFDGANSWAWALNQAGDIAGDYYPPVSELAAYLWQNGQKVNLGTLRPGGSQSHEVNDLDQVVGESGGIFDTTAFLWDNGVLTDLGTLGGDESQAFAINNAGQVVGFSETVPGDNGGLGFFWEAGVMQPIPTLGGDSGSANDINESGLIVGNADVMDDPVILHAFVWDGTTMTDLGTLSGDRWSVAYGINDLGEVIGYSHGLVKDSAFIWRNGVMTSIHTNGVVGPDSHAHAINSHSEVVGFGSSTPGGNLVFQPSTGMKRSA